jgi:hypothetical protein
MTPDENDIATENNGNIRNLERYSRLRGTLSGEQLGESQEIIV